MSRLLIIGFGNPLRGDDAAGWMAAERLSARVRGAGVEIIAAQQLTPELADPISRADGVLFIDARCGGPPGELRIERLEGAEAAGGRFTHHASPAALLALARRLYGRAPAAELWSIGAESFEFGAGLSGSVAEGLDELVDRVAERITGAKQGSACFRTKRSE